MSEAARYQLRTRIATGGMGEVWRSEDTLLEREVAVKVLKHEYADDPTFRSRFEAEARNAAALHHPNVASVFDVGEISDDGAAGGRPFLVMELVPGEPLSALLRGGEPMPPERAADIVAQAADAVAAAHALGIVHRDVKPANLLVTPDGTVKITDFGIARAGDGAAITQTGQIIGTPHYISPEQAEGHPASAASDVYALGVVLYECLAGRRPFDRDTPIQVALAHVRDPAPPLPETVPAALRAVVQKALAKRPEDRFPSAAALAVALRGGEVPGLPGVAATAISAVPPPTRRRGLPVWWPWAAAVAGVLLVVLGAAAVGRGGQEAPSAAADGAAEQAADQGAVQSRVRVREATYLGRPFSDVKEELESLDLRVEKARVSATSRQDVKDTVAALSPTGLVDPGSTVRVEVYEEFLAPAPTRNEHDDREGEEKDEEEHGQKDGRKDLERNAKEDKEDKDAGERGKSDDKPGKGEKGKKDD